MKIRLTEGQYKRLLSEDNKGGFITITPKVIRLMELINKHIGYNATKGEVLKLVRDDMGLSHNEFLTIYNSWIIDFKELDVEEYRGLLGKEMEFKGIWAIQTYIPTYLCGRTHLPGFINVEASSEEEDLELSKTIPHSDLDVEFDETSWEYQNPELDFDYDDADMLKDMVQDHMHDVSISNMSGRIRLVN